MNLYANDKDGNSVQLWQTPTWITNLAMYNKKRNRRKWKSTRHIYIAWVEQRLNGAWDDDDEYYAARSRVEDHVNAVKSAGKLKFYVM